MVTPGARKAFPVSLVQPASKASVALQGKMAILAKTAFRDQPARLALPVPQVQRASKGLQGLVSGLMAMTARMVFRFRDRKASLGFR
jgi:hypothetical protein